MTPPTSAAMECAKAMFPHGNPLTPTTFNTAEFCLLRSSFWINQAAIIDKHFPPDERVKELQDVINAVFKIAADVHRMGFADRLDEIYNITKKFIHQPKQPKAGA